MRLQVQLNLKSMKNGKHSNSIRTKMVGGGTKRTSANRDPIVRIWRIRACSFGLTKQSGLIRDR